MDEQHRSLSIRRQCELLGLPRSSYYYAPATESEENLDLMRRIDELYLQRPFFGSRRMAEHLSVPEAPLNRKRVQRLMRCQSAFQMQPLIGASNAASGEWFYNPYNSYAWQVPCSSEADFRSVGGP